MNYNTTKFINDLKAIGIELSDEQLEQFLTYYEMLIEKNKVMNLTAITDFDEVLEKHFEDSLSLIKAVDLEKSQAVIDLGTGAGFPGIPLKIAFPNLKITLMDSLNKRVKFYSLFLGNLELGQRYVNICFLAPVEFKSGAYTFKYLLSCPGTI